MSSQPLNFGVRMFQPTADAKPDLLKRLLRQALDRTSAQARRDMQKITATWEVKPAYTVKTSMKGGNLTSSIYTTNFIFRLLSKGSPAHKIHARGALYPLIFNHGSGFIAKTKPNFIGSIRGADSGKLVRVLSVNHPGHKARNYTQIIAARLRDKLTADVNTAMRTYLGQTTRPAQRNRNA